MSKKVLLVDDVRFFIELEKGYLVKTDCDILTASGSVEALKICLQEKPDLVFLDYEMPNMNGLEFLQCKTQQAEIKDIPVVIVSAFTDQALEKKLTEAGAVAVIKKPFPEDVFLTLANKLMGLDKRKRDRIPVEVPAFYGFEDKMDKAIIVNLSEGGAFITCERLLQEHASFELKFLMPESGNVIKTWCKVVWLNTEDKKTNPRFPVGMGIEFIGMNKSEIVELKNFIKKHGHGSENS